MSVQEYLNDKFPGLNDLKGGVDTQTNLLTRKDEELVGKLDQLRCENIQNRRDNIFQLREELLALNKQDGVFANYSALENLPDTTRNALLENLNHIRDLKEMNTLVAHLDRLSEKGHMLLNESDSVKEQKIFQKVLQLEENIWTTSHNSPNIVTRSLADRSYKFIVKTIHEPYYNKVLDSFKTYLTEIDWPKSEPSINDVKFSSLLVWGLEAEVIDKAVSPAQPIPRGAFKVLCRPLEVRFNYHFNSNRDTNRLDKPEWALNHVLDLIDSHKLFFTQVIQPIVQKRFPQLLAVDEFISALLPMVYKKAIISLDELSEDPQLQSHWYEELISFDNSLSARFFYRPQNIEHWKGIAGDILSQNNRFEKWLKFESEAAHSQYNDITGSPNSWDIDWESVDQYTTKPTLSAINLKTLFESVTETYSSLRPVRFRLRFLLDIQISLLDMYYARLSESISAYDSMSSTLSRAVGSVTAEDAKLVVGINGLERLCKIYGSLDYMSNCLEAWGQDLFFLELWDDISRLSSKAREKEAKPSSSVKIPGNEEDEGTLFDETLASYLKLKGRVSLSINSLIRKELQAGMKEYFRFGVWSLDSPPQDMSSRLRAPIQKLTKYFVFLRKFYSQNTFTLFIKEFSHQIEKNIWNYIIQANRFNVYGGQQLQNDLSEIWIAFMLPRNKSWHRLQQVCMLLISENGLGLLSYPSQEQLEKAEITQLTSEEVHGILRRRV